MAEKLRTIGEPVALPPLDDSTGDVEFDSQTEPFDTDAPYGYKADGTPKKKPGRPKGSTNAIGSGSSRGSGSDSAFADRISNELIELSAPLAIVSPMAMGHVARSADRTSRALVNISKKHPRVKLAINAYFDSISYKDLALFVIGIPVAVMMDFGMLKHDSKIGIPWHMEEIWQECYGEEMNGTETSMNGAGYRGLAGEI